MVWPRRREFVLCCCQGRISGRVSRLKMAPPYQV
uniref:Uncharacterized protein n=1 Tax=Anguilla anguilla TaxID=7936 RepID=A0A0E9VL26_ANGAN